MADEITQRSALESQRVDGRLHMRFVHDAARQRTLLAEHVQQPPLQIIRPFDLDGRAICVHLHNVSGGVLGGDDLELKVMLEAQARAQLTTTGATRIYRSRDEQAVAVQRTTIVAGPGSLLEYLPDPTIPFAGSRYRQATRIDLAADAGLFWWEIVAPGREASGEIFAYDLLHLSFDLFADGRPIALERARLEPRQRPLDSIARLGHYRYFANFYICRVGLDPARWRALEAQLADTALRLSVPGQTIWGVSTLPQHGIVVRAVSASGRTLPGGLLACWQAAKADLYGQPAVVPRKLY
jgi:urease accessory protein